MNTAPELLCELSDLHVYYGQAHVLQGIDLKLAADGVFAIVGRNGMGKTTLCNSLVGFLKPARGKILLNQKNILGEEPHKIARLGVAYVPQGRRVWPSLTVEEHLRLVEQKAKPWSVDRVFDTFPRLAERRKNGGNQLSGGEQQMLAIGRALLANPKLLIMDEPTEGLAPVIVDQVEELLIKLATEETISILLIEQNLGVALRVAERVSVMVNGRIEATMDSSELAGDPHLQQRLLGIGG